MLKKAILASVVLFGIQVCASSQDVSNSSSESVQVITNRVSASGLLCDLDHSPANLGYNPTLEEIRKEHENLLILLNKIQRLKEQTLSEKLDTYSDFYAYDHCLSHEPHIEDLLSKGFGSN